jgi:hypothetical protein
MTTRHLLPSSSRLFRGAARLFGLGVLASALGGCTVLAVADVAASAVVGTAGLVVDAAVGTARIGGKVIGKTADVVLGSDEAAAAD